jgi:hypothetical protein
VSEQSSQSPLTGLRREDSIVVRLNAAIPLDPLGAWWTRADVLREEARTNPARLEPSKSERVCDSS